MALPLVLLHNYKNNYTLKTNTMNTQLQKIITINNKDSIFKVSARELYEFFGNSERFSRWWDRYSDYGFEKGNDYTPYQYVHPMNNQDTDDYLLTIDMAKEISMLQRNEKGKEARKYFIEVEKEVRRFFENKNLINLIMSNAPIEEQIQNSKDTNKTIQEKYNCEYSKINAKITKDISGKYPAEWKEEAKKKGIKAINRTSGKEAIRKLEPDLAIAISTADDCLCSNMSINDSIEIGKLSIPLAKKIVEINRRYIK